MRTAFLVAAIVALLPTLALSQSISDIEHKYGKRVDVYSVSKSVWMTPRYDAEGQVCQLRFYAKRVSSDTNYLGDTLPADEVLKVLDELIPIPTRGARRDGFGLGLGNINGGIAWTNFDYEKVSFTFISAIGRPIGPLTGENIGLDFPIDPEFEKKHQEELRKIAATPDNELMRRQAFNAKILEVTLLTRKCPAQ